MLMYLFEREVSNYHHNSSAFYRHFCAIVGEGTVGTTTVQCVLKEQEEATEGEVMRESKEYYVVH